MNSISLTGSCKMQINKQMGFVSQYNFILKEKLSSNSLIFKN